MSQAVVEKTAVITLGASDPSFDELLKAFVTAMAARRRAASDYTAALDAVIASALTSAIIHKDCGSMTRILHAMEDAEEPQAVIQRTCAAIVEYTQDALMLPAGTIVYMPARKDAPGRFGCRAATTHTFLAEVGEDWSTEHDGAPAPTAAELWNDWLANSPTFSAWQAARKKAKAKAKASAQERLTQACKRALAILDEDFFIDTDDDSVEAIRRALGAYINR